MIQPILCSDKPISTDISVFLDSSESTYEVYIGVALLERVNIDPEDLQYKMLVGRLWNAGVKLCLLRETFGHDNRTIKKWGNALNSGDLDEMVHAFSGRQYRKKVSPELIRYAQQLYRTRSLLGKNYREKIIRKIEEVFGVTISCSLASELFKSIEQCEIKEHNSIEDEGDIRDNTGHSEQQLGSKKEQSVQKSPIFPFVEKSDDTGYNSTILLRHVGLIFFGLWLRFYNSIEQQVLCQVLQGAVNVEQSKLLCNQSLKYFCNSPVAILREQRKALEKESSQENILRLYHLNNQLLSDGPNNGTLFYFDPHTKEYTGLLKTLKGWSGRRHGICKVVNLDCFHTKSGRPCFIQHYSPFYDMRERFFMSLKLFDSLFDEDKRQGRTFVIDRGIYGLETLKNFDKDYVITWEKGFDGTGWKDDKPSLTFTRQRRKNKQSDLQTYTFTCQETTWARDEKFRRIIVKARKNDGREITVSVICSNPDMDIQDTVWAIFNRWLQENDFKYLDVYFGINQLDSRAHTTFANQTDSFKDRSTDSPEYKDMKKTLQNTEGRFARHLLTFRKKRKDAENIKKEIRKVKALISRQKKKLNETKAEEKGQSCKRAENSLKKYEKEEKRLKKMLVNIEGKISELEQVSASFEKEITLLGEALNNTIRKTSRLQQLIDGHYKLLDLRRKAYMDALRINAANQFRNLHDCFRPICNNFRDDHAKLRMLTRCSGFIQNYADTLKVKLWLPGSIQTHILEHMKTFTKEIENKLNAESHGGSTQFTIELHTGPIQS